MKEPIDYAILFCKVWMWALSIIAVINFIEFCFLLGDLYEKLRTH